LTVAALTAVTADAPCVAGRSPFDLDDEAAYQAWREAKLADVPRSAEAVLVELRDPRRLSPTERAALLDRCARYNMALYRSPVVDADKSLPRMLGRQLGMVRLDANWLADEDGISPITVREGQGPAAGFIPYTNRPIKWHTDGYYHPLQRAIRGMLLHCVRSAASGGSNRLLDPELAYIALRDADPAHVRALMADDAMTIPARTDDEGIARPAQTGPVLAIDAAGFLQMRYTARTRSIQWKDEAGMGMVTNNVLHDREAFIDDPRHPRLLYRARYLDRVGAAPVGD
jgi:alpha-ketoglutarate-dependent taurine dioxygenase